ncbi:MAG: TetR/AcrR family transcriptional regulator [Deltaproteobacteria bacterium]|nr:TetR/AcrR family transcriptional regulator [Deltaproteobacteria bacterium]
MSVRRTRAQQVEDNDVRLLAAARKVFVRSGFHAASLDAVAREAGLTKGAVYARYESKADLMFALLEDRVTARAGQMISVAVPESREKTAGAIASQFAALVAKDREWSLLVVEFRVHVARDRALNARFRALNELLVANVSALATKAGVAPGVAADLARAAVALANGFALERWADPRSFPDSLLEHAAQALVRGMTP